MITSRFRALAGLIALSLAGLGLGLQVARAQGPAKIDIPYQKFVLKNGLTLLVHEDHKAPIVAVNVWYHVGSKNEKLGKTGFAHLFEHLMFNGSENFNDDYFKVLEKLGATDLNGTTNNDRTNYFQNVPTSALDVVLWMESDRMGHLLGAISQARLDEQRGVVQNEKRQGENQPYGRVYTTISDNTYPKGHPYSWSVIGSMEDLSAASLDDAREWFKGYYGRPMPSSRLRATLMQKQRARRWNGISAIFLRARPSPNTRRGSPSKRVYIGSSCRTACRRLASTRSGTLRSGVRRRTITWIS
jgi:zinc protease